MGYGGCQVCGAIRGLQRHHRFPQKKLYRKVYGKLLDESFNILLVCPDCHVSHRKIPKDEIWDERKFREEAIKWDKETGVFKKIFRKSGGELPEGSKSFQMKVGMG